MDGLQVQVPGGGTGGTSTVQEEGVTQSTSVTTFNFVGAGVTASGGGATATITIPGGSSSSFTATMITVDYSNPIYAEATVTDASITATDKILVSWGMITDADENTPDMDDVNFSAVAGTGSMVVRISTSDFLSRIGGTYKIMYMKG